MNNPFVGIIMGSDSDLPVMKEAAALLDEFGLAYECTVVSAHRTPERLMSYAATAAERGLEVIIAGAGGAAHLPGMVAAVTPLPVIGVPVRSSNLQGLDSLLSIVQMPGGVPVATVAINGARNAGLLAVSMLGIKDAALREKLARFKEDLRTSVEDKAAHLESMGWQAYLEGKNG
jgi:5-(carboxyamino)imidazole ribonucleotide mutase